MSLNLYAYCKGNPNRYVDPTGHFVCTITGIVVGGIIGGVDAALNNRDFWTGVLAGAVSGGTVGLAADFVVATGGTGAAAVGALALAGGVGGAAADGINQIGNQWKWGKGVSLQMAAKNVSAASLIKSAAIGAAAGALTGEQVWYWQKSKALLLDCIQRRC